MPDVILDRRNAPRYALILAAEVTELPSGTKLGARSSDISRSGCYIDTLNPIAIGSPVRIRLTRGGDAFEASGEVMYVSRGLGMGIAFDEQTSSTQLTVLDRWLADASKQA